MQEDEIADLKQALAELETKSSGRGHDVVTWYVNEAARIIALRLAQSIESPSPELLTGNKLVTVRRGWSLLQILMSIVLAQDWDELERLATAMVHAEESGDVDDQTG